MQAGMNQWFRNGKKRYALFTAAAVFLCAGIIYIGAGGITDQWKYRLQQTLFHCSGEMYMPGILYAGSPEKQGASGWLREKALAWMPLIGYVEDHIPYEETSQSISLRNSSWVSTGIPSSRAFRSLEPAASPATT